MVFEKSPFHVHGGPRINFTSNFRWIFDAFLLQKLFETRIEKTFGTIIDFLLNLRRFYIDFGTPNRQKGTKKGDFFEACCLKGCPEASGDALGTNFDAPGRSF